MLVLHSLLRQFDPSIPLTNLANPEVHGVTDDSRQVGPGFLFIARVGEKADGRKFVEDARQRGAVAVVAAADAAVPGCPLPQVLVRDVGPATSRLANLFHDSPSSRVDVLGVTGTNGKTTTTYLIRHLLAKVQRRCGLIGTVEVDDGRSRREALMTTPSAVEIASLLATMRDKGVWSCAMEVSSHALHQGRTAGVRFAGAAFTNLTGDHLDYHETMEAYAAAKARLFEGLDASAVAVVNANDRRSDRMVQGTRARVISFGIGRKGDYRACDVRVSMEGTRFKLIGPGGEAEVFLPMIGEHNVANALTACALVGEVYNLTVSQLATALADATGAPGRLQPVRCGQPFGVFVDYAHTDDGLKNVLTAIRPLVKGKLRVLFGCGGDRDRKKRPRMARVAERLADAVYVTSDNPRTEGPLAIIQDVLEGFSPAVEVSGCERPGRTGRPLARGGAASAIVEVDRRRAIERILRDAREGDVVLLAGKGHENYQIVAAEGGGTEKRHFDDVEEAMRVLGQQSTAAA